jgi:hypothetical protein
MQKMVPSIVLSDPWVDVVVVWLWCARNVGIRVVRSPNHAVMVVDIALEVLGAVWVVGLPYARQEGYVE